MSLMLELTKPTSVAPPPSITSLDKLPVNTPAPAQAPPPEPFEYYDAGNHWCKDCNVTSGSMFDFFTHLHSKSHRKTLDPYNRPWASTPSKITKSMPSEEKLTKPAKGSEFLVPVRGFFCLLCKEFYGDAICAEEHVVTHAHNEKYKKQMYENPLYEQRRNLDRQAGLAMDMSGKKHKYDDDDKGGKDKDEKAKNKKEKKEKKKEEEEDAAVKEEKSKIKREEEEEKLKPNKKEEDFRKTFVEEKPSYSKKDEDEKYRYIKKDDKYRFSREDEDRAGWYRNTGRDHRYRRDGDDRPKYGSRDDEDSYKSDKYSAVRSRERDEGKTKAEREASKKAEPDKPSGKPDVSKFDPPPKPYEMPKIFCGPSPAMRAKLRKQSLEASKPAPATAGTSFGKFTWKKKENQLAQEAQKVAAEFIKDDEMAAKDKSVTAADSFAKSMAVAKEIAQKLGSEQTMPPPWSPANRGRIRPNLPAPSAQLRKTAVAGKPAPLNTFLSIRPQNTSMYGPYPSPPIRPQNDHSAPAEVKPLPQANIPEPTQAVPPEPFGPKLPSSMIRPPTSEENSAAAVSKPITVEPKPAPFDTKPNPPVSKPAPVESLFGVSCAPPVSEPSPTESTKPAPAIVKPASSQATTVSAVLPEATPAEPTIVEIVSDVAAPGVPENEQTRTVFVKPAPFMRKAEGTPKFNKLKSNLAAAKAQELFGIFYSSTSQSSPSSFYKQEPDTRAGTIKSPLATRQVPKPQGKPGQPQPQNLIQPQVQDQQEAQLKTQPKPQTKPQPFPHVQDLNKSQQVQEKSKMQPEPQTQPESQVPEKEHPKTQPEPQVPGKEHLRTQPEPQTPPESQVSEKEPPKMEPKPQTQLQLQVLDQDHPKTRPELQSRPQAESGIQIMSVWSLLSSKPPVAESVPPETSLPTTHPKPAQFKTQSLPQNQSSPSNSEAQITPTNSTVLEATLDHQDKPEQEPESELKPEQDSSSHLEVAQEPQSKPKLGPKTRGKVTPTKKTSPASGPTRQTRSQTRYQTRRQQKQSQPEPEPEPASEDPGSDTKGLDASDLGSGLQPEVGATTEEDPPLMEITPETLGLPSDMTSLDFDYNFNFE